MGRSNRTICKAKGRKKNTSRNLHSDLLLSGQMVKEGTAATAAGDGEVWSILLEWIWFEFPAREQRQVIAVRERSSRRKRKKEREEWKDGSIGRKAIAFNDSLQFFFYSTNRRLTVKAAAAAPCVYVRGFSQWESVATIFTFILLCLNSWRPSCVECEKRKQRTEQKLHSTAGHQSTYHFASLFIIRSSLQESAEDCKSTFGLRIEIRGKCDVWGVSCKQWNCTSPLDHCFDLGSGHTLFVNQWKLSKTLYCVSSFLFPVKTFLILWFFVRQTNTNHSLILSQSAGLFSFAPSLMIPSDSLDWSLDVNIFCFRRHKKYDWCWGACNKKDREVTSEKKKQEIHEEQATHWIIISGTLHHWTSRTELSGQYVVVVGCCGPSCRHPHTPIHQCNINSHCIKW